MSHLGNYKGTPEMQELMKLSKTELPSFRFKHRMTPEKLAALLVNDPVPDNSPSILISDKSNSYKNKKLYLADDNGNMEEVDQVMETKVQEGHPGKVTLKIELKDI